MNINFRLKTFNPYVAFSSPSMVSKFLPNTKGLSKEKINKVYNAINPLYIGNTVHSIIEVMLDLFKQGSYFNCVDIATEVISTRGYKRGERTAQHKYSSDDLTNNYVIIENIKWLMQFIDLDNDLIEQPINQVHIDNKIWSGTADLIKFTSENECELYDFKNYNGTSEYDNQVQLNQLYIYSLMISAKGYKVNKVHILNPIERTQVTRNITAKFLQHFLDTQISEM
jgi:hypothetical protein